MKNFVNLKAFDILDSINLIDCAVRSLYLDIFQVRVELFAPQEIDGLKFLDSANCTNISLAFSGADNLNCTIQKKAYPTPYLENGELAAFDFLSFENEKIKIDKVDVPFTLNEIGLVDYEAELFRAEITFNAGSITFHFTELSISNFEFDFEKTSDLVQI